MKLEARTRQNKLIFKGLKVTAKTTDYNHIVKQFCREMFGSGIYGLTKTPTWKITHNNICQSTQ